MISREFLTALIFTGMFSGLASAAHGEDTTGGSGTVTRRTYTESSSSVTRSGGAAGEKSIGKTGESSSEVVEQSGVMGFRKSNKFAPKYKERIETYKHQIDLGLTKGWLSADDADRFKKELVRLAELEKSVSQKGWQKAEVDDLDKQFTKFNMDFSRAGSKTPAQTSSGASPSAAAKKETTAPKPGGSSKSPASGASGSSAKSTPTKSPAPAGKPAPKGSGGS